jgi:hypothetical protein
MAWAMTPVVQELRLLPAFCKTLHRRRISRSTYFGFGASATGAEEPPGEMAPCNLLIVEQGWYHAPIENERS